MSKLSDFFVSLRARLTLSFFIFSIVLVASIAVFAQYIARDALRENIVGRLTTISHLKESELNRWNETNKKIIELLAERPLVVEYARQLIHSPQAADPGIRDQLIRYHFEPALEQQGGFQDLMLIDPDSGMIVASSSPDLEGKFRESKHFFLEGRQRTYVDHPYYELSVDRSVIHISTPVKDEDGQLLAILAGHVDIDEMSHIMAEERALSASLETYLVNQSNLLVTESRFEEEAAFRKSIFTPGINACLEGENGHGIYGDYRGIEVLGVYRWLPAWGMCIMTEQDVSEAFAPVSSVRNAIFQVGIGVISLGALIGLLTALSITRPLQQLKRGVQAFGEGNLDARIQVDTQDEIGELAATVNHMAANLKRSREKTERLIQELQGWGEQLEEQVEERTLELRNEIEERKEAERQLEETMRELERSNQELQRFAYVASHDLQEPLRMVTSYLQLLERRYQDVLDGEAEEFIAYAVDGAIRMKELINDLLTYSRVNTHGKAFQQVDTREVLVSVKEDLKLLIAETGTRITHGTLHTVQADPSQLRQLFQNLVGNAIKFRAQQDPEIHISAQHKNQSWEFAVQDNGIGIDEQYQERVFVIFQRLHTRDEYQGTGIGLAVSKRIVERHGGKIWFESAPGEGTTFFFTIPDEPEERIK